MIVPVTPLAEVTHRAIHVLTREIGVADTLRFLRQFAIGTGNYTEEREALLGDPSLDELLGEIRRDPDWQKPG